jgi:hypothetical protein
MDQKPFLYLDGLEEIVKELNGQEKIHIGIRPYGFHAGNALAFVAYSSLLCKKYLQSQNKEPEFQFIISINDWEQDALDGPDYRQWPFNIFPKTTTIQMLEHDSTGTKMADFWQPIIESAVKFGLRNYPKVKVNFYRNSELKNTPEFRDVLIDTINNPLKQFQIYKNVSNFPVLDSPIGYASAVCPKCKKAHGTTKYIDGKIHWKCSDCSFEKIDDYENFDYWWYHKMLLIGRIKLFKFDILLSGGDHFSENDFDIRKALIKEFLPDIKVPKMLFTPTLLSPLDNKRMSKTKFNIVYADLVKLIDLAEVSRDTTIILPDDVQLKYNEQEYKEYINSLEPIRFWTNGADDTTNTRVIKEEIG